MLLMRLGSQGQSGSRSVAGLIVALAAALLPGQQAQAVEGDLLGFLPFETIAPQDIAYDTQDDVYWVTGFLANQIFRYSNDLKVVDEDLSIPAPGENFFPTGVAYDEANNTLWVVNSLTNTIVEVSKEPETYGAPTGREFLPSFLEGSSTGYLPRGLRYNPVGINGQPSLMMLEFQGTVLYELDFEGNLLQSFTHPDDEDGFPGHGLKAQSSDVDIITDESGNVTGYYVTGGNDAINLIRKLDADGVWRGITIDITDAAGTVSAFLRRPFPHPVTGVVTDSYICVVESNAGFAILEGGEPEFREITRYDCEIVDDEIIATWESLESYDSIEIFEDCNLLAQLPGDAREFHFVPPHDGVFDLTLIATKGEDFSAPAPCRTVIGPGEIVNRGLISALLPTDVAQTETGAFLVTDRSLDAILLIDPITYEIIDELVIDTLFLESGDLLTGIAYSEASGRIYVANASKALIGELDGSGIMRRSFEPDLPNLRADPEAEPFRGTIGGMFFDPQGDSDNGSIWLLEMNRDVIYEIDLFGNILTSFPHPYLSLDPPEPNPQGGISSSGIAQVPGVSGEIYVTAGTFDSGGQIHIIRVEKETGIAIPGSEIPMEGRILDNVSCNRGFPLI